MRFAESAIENRTTGHGRNPLVLGLHQLCEALDRANRQGASKPDDLAIFGCEPCRIPALPGLPPPLKEAGRQDALVPCTRP